MTRKTRNKKQNIIISTITIIIILCVAYQNEIKTFMTEPLIEPKETYKLENIPDYNGKAYIEINNNRPNFTEEDYSKKKFGKIN